MESWIGDLPVVQRLAVAIAREDLRPDDRETFDRVLERREGYDNPRTQRIVAQYLPHAWAALDVATPAIELALLVRLRGQVEAELKDQERTLMAWTEDYIPVPEVQKWTNLVRIRAWLVAAIKGMEEA